VQVTFRKYTIAYAVAVRYVSVGQAAVTEGENMSKMSIGTIRRIAEQKCFMLDDTIRLREPFSKIVSYNAQLLINQGVIHRNDDATVTITEIGRKLLDRELPDQTVLRALRFAPMKMLGDVSLPGRVRRVTIEQLEHEGYVKVDGAVVTLTEKGKLRIAGDVVQNPLSAKTIFHVLRAMPANMVGEKTVPGNIRKDTIHRMMRLGLIQMDDFEISLTPAGESRLGKRRLVFSVPAHMVDRVNQAVAGVLENDHDRHHE
jgi:ribosomal protein S19E (S16A)